MPTDGDIYYLLKRPLSDDPRYIENFSYKRLKPLWKSFIEYDRIFRGIGWHKEEKIQTRAKKVLKPFWDEHEFNYDDLLIVSAVSKLARIKEASVYIVFDDKCISYTEAFNKKEDKDSDESIKFFYVYVPEEAIKFKKDIIEILLRSV